MSQGIPDNPRVTEIVPTTGWRLLDLREVWEYRDLIVILVTRDIKVRYRQTFLGIGWVLAQPLITMGFFTLLLNRVAKIDSSSGVPYPIFILAGLVPWTFFASSVANSGNSLIGSAHLISKVYFPRMIVPAAAVVGAAADMLVTLGLVAVMMFAYGISPSPAVVLLPLVILICAALALGIGLWCSALNVEYRDVRVIVPFVIQLWMYGTPVVYPLSVLPEWAQRVARLNPMTTVVDLTRVSMFGGSMPTGGVVWLLLCTGVVLVSGAFYFRRSERRFADVL